MTSCRPLWLGVRAAVNGQRRASDVLGLGARQERNGVGDVVRLAIPTLRHELRQRVRGWAVRR